MNIFTLIGILSAVIFFLGDIPYLLDTIKKKIQPHRVTWGIIWLQNIIAFASLYAEGARNSIMIVGAAIVIIGAIFIAALFNGTGGTSKQDIIALILSLAGVLLWAVTSNPVLSIAANCFAVVVGVYPTLIKARDNPSSENPSAYFFGAISSFLAAVSVGSFNLPLLILPTLSVSIQVYLVYLIRFRKPSASV